MTPRIKLVIASVIIGAVIATSIFSNPPGSTTPHNLASILIY